MAKELSEEWIKYADEDKKMAELALQDGGPANQICFHCQQQAEKYLKAYLALKDARFEKSHQLDYLLYLCETLDKSFNELTSAIEYLADFYTETRYPGDIPEFSLSEAKKAYESAIVIKEFVLQKINRNK